MACIEQLVKSLMEQECGSLDIREGSIELLHPYGEHIVLLDDGPVVARSVTDENMKVGDIVSVLVAGDQTLILGGKH